MRAEPSPSFVYGPSGSQTATHMSVVNRNTSEDMFVTAMFAKMGVAELEGGYSEDSSSILELGGVAVAGFSVPDATQFQANTHWSEFTF